MSQFFNTIFCKHIQTSGVAILLERYILICIGIVVEAPPLQRQQPCQLIPSKEQPIVVETANPKDAAKASKIHSAMIFYLCVKLIRIMGLR
jgi:hypothetical protein